MLALPMAVPVLIHADVREYDAMKLQYSFGLNFQLI